MKAEKYITSKTLFSKQDPFLADAGHNYSLRHFCVLYVLSEIILWNAKFSLKLSRIFQKFLQCFFLVSP